MEHKPDLKEIPFDAIRKIINASFHMEMKDYIQYHLQEAQEFAGNKKGFAKHVIEHMFIEYSLVSDWLWGRDKDIEDELDKALERAFTWTQERQDKEDKEEGETQ